MYIFHSIDHMALFMLSFHPTDPIIILFVLRQTFNTNDSLAIPMQILHTTGLLGLLIVMQTFHPTELAYLLIVMQTFHPTERIGILI